jgi:hypothetical protein
VIRQIGPERAALSSRRGAARDDVSRILRKAIDRLSEIVHQQEQLQQASRCA